MHSTDNLEDGYLGSGKRLWYSINYHGRDNHTKEILEFYENREELKKRETEIVNEQLINEELCMNLKNGGEGGFTSEGHREKFINTKNRLLAKKNSEKTQKWLIENNPSWNKKRLKNISKGLKNNTTIINGTFKSKTHSEEAKKKISEKAKQRTGERNSQYGTCWVTKDGENKKIKKELLPDYQNNGWVRGRK